MDSHRRVLRKYQRSVLYETLTRPYNALFLDMRLGKTLIAIRSIVARLPKVESVLIIAPYSAFPAWHDELIRERFTEKEIIFLTGEGKKRKALFTSAINDNKIKWFILNVEGWRALPEIADVNWQAMVFDESYALQSPPHISKKTKTACTSKFFTLNFRNVPYKYILTGTPAPESELNYFMQLLFLDKSILLEDNYWKFRMRHFIQYAPHEYAISERGKKFLTSRLSTCAIFLSRKDVSLGGEKIYETRSIALDKETRKIYDDIWDRFVVKIGEEIRDVTDIGGVRFSWARRLLGGYVTRLTQEKEGLLTPEIYESYEYIFDGKLIELNNLLNGELKNQQVVIWADFTKEIDLLNQYMSKSKRKSYHIDGRVGPWQRDEVEKEFRAGNIQYLICQPQASQYSRDFSSADVEIFYSSPLALKTRLQAEDRLISSKTNSVLVIDLVCKDTIEEDIIESLRKKESKQEMIRRIVKHLTRSVYGKNDVQ